VLPPGGASLEGPVKLSRPFWTAFRVVVGVGAGTEWPRDISFSIPPLERTEGGTPCAAATGNRPTDQRQRSVGPHGSTSHLRGDPRRAASLTRRHHGPQWLEQRAIQRCCAPLEHGYTARLDDWHAAVHWRPSCASAQWLPKRLRIPSESQSRPSSFAHWARVLAPEILSEMLTWPPRRSSGKTPCGTIDHAHATRWLITPCLRLGAPTSTTDACNARLALFATWDGYARQANKRCN
jgi:hypothetical protein